MFFPVALHRLPTGTMLAAHPPAGDEDDRAVRFVAGHARAVDRKQLPDLLGDSLEHGFRCRPSGHERRDPPQRRLLLRQTCEPGATLGVRDRCGEQVGEVGEPRFGVRR
jgi:hypothetical protein